MRKPTVIVALSLVAAGLLTGAASCDGTPSSVANDQSATNRQLDRYQANQPIHQYDWSQYRQTLIDVEDAQVHGVATTTFFFNLGTAKPIKVCPSLGFPVPTTAQLTNPDQYIGVPNVAGGGVVAQQEPNGAYTGQSSGTYVVCVAPSGTKYISYWEGDVQTEGGPAHWDDAQGRIVLDGAPSVVAKTK